MIACFQNDKSPEGMETPKSPLGVKETPQKTSGKQQGKVK